MWPVHVFAPHDGSDERPADTSIERLRRLVKASVLARD